MIETRKIDLFIFIVVVWLFTLLAPSHHLTASDGKDEVKRGVAKITAYKPGDATETGAGVVLTIERQKIFIMTAYHVIAEANRISVKFYEYPTERLVGKPSEQYDEENDLAVIYVEILKKPKKISILHLGDINKIAELDEVYAIGHPLDKEWEFSSAEIRTSPEPSQFRIAGNAVDPGNSGGALLNKKFQIIGLVTEKGRRDGIALKIDSALEILKGWKIPYDIKRKSKLWPWIAGGVGAAGVTAVLIWKPWSNGNGEEEGFPFPPGRPK